MLVPERLTRIPRRGWSRFYLWWSALASQEKRQIHALNLILVGYLAHYLVFTIFQPFFIEDAGISFAYARNLFDGFGFVTYPGGERVEGFSNPSWTFLIGLLYFLRIPVWTSSKLLGAVFGGLALVLAWAITRRARGGRNDLANVAPSFLLAASTQFVLWNASGLENSLFCVLLAAALYRTIREGSEGGRPWSALLYVLLATTRPEGVIYAVAGGLARAVFALRQPRFFLTMLRWTAIFVVPFAAFQLWRSTYFGWTFPNTFYAKLDGQDRFKPFGWEINGWRYLRNYWKTYWIAYVSPLFLLGLLGSKRWRAYVGYALLVPFGILVLWNGHVGFLERVSWWGPVKRNWVDARLWWIYGSAAVACILVIGKEGWRARLATWLTFSAAVFFVIYSGGDWMDAFRLGSFLSVPEFLLLGWGLAELVSLLPELRWRLPGRIRLQTVLMAAATLAVALPDARGSYKFTMGPETSVRDVRRRVGYMSWVQKKLFIDDVTVFDVDMGAHMWFSGWKIMDIAGLVDVPMGHHQKFQKAFLQEYVFKERKPEFFHIHGGWAKRSKMNIMPEFKQNYVEIPGYPSGGKSLHGGNHVRRDFFAKKAYEGPPDRRIDFAGGIILEGWNVPSPIVPVGGKYYLETWFRGIRLRQGFRAYFFLYDDAGHLSVQEVAPGWDWFQPKDWKISDHVTGRYGVQVSDDLPEGTYQLGLVLIDQKTGEVIRRTATPIEVPETSEEESEGREEDQDENSDEKETPEAADGDDAPAENAAGEPTVDQGSEADVREAEGEALSGEVAVLPEEPVVYLAGEVLLPGTVMVVSRERALQEAVADYQSSLDEAAAGQCEVAWQSWLDARRHVLRNTSWQDNHEDAAHAAMAGCFVGRADLVVGDDEKAPLLVQARFYDFDDEAMLAEARPMAVRFERKGDALRVAEDWDGAYAAYSTALSLDPTRSFARRHAEEVRDHRLGLDGKRKEASRDDDKPKPKARDGRPPPRTANHPPARGPRVENPEDEVPAGAANGGGDVEEIGGDKADRVPASVLPDDDEIDPKLPPLRPRRVRVQPREAGDGRDEP